MHTLLDVCLLAKLSAGDMMATEAKYHAQCLAGLYNKMEDTDSTELVENSVAQAGSAEGTLLHNVYIRGIEFAQLAAYSEKVKFDAITLPIFKGVGMVIRMEGQMVSMGA